MFKKISAAAAALALVFCMPLSAFAEEDTAPDNTTEALTQAVDEEQPSEEKTEEATAEEPTEETEDTSDNTEAEQAEYSVTLDAASDVSECSVGDVFEVSITAVNTGNTALTNVKLMFEDTVVDEAQTLAPSETFSIVIKLRADEVDIGESSVNVSVTADELAAPVTGSVAVTVYPAQEQEDEEGDEPSTDTAEEPAEDENTETAEADKTAAEQTPAKTGITSNPKTGAAVTALTAAAALLTMLGRRRDD